MQLKPQCNILIRISELEDRLIDVTPKEKKNEQKCYKNNPSAMGNIKYCNIYILGITEGEEREKEVEKIFQEINAKIFLYW